MSPEEYKNFLDQRGSIVGNVVKENSNNKPEEVSSTKTNQVTSSTKQEKPLIKFTTGEIKAIKQGVFHKIGKAKRALLTPEVKNAPTNSSMEQQVQHIPALTNSSMEQQVQHIPALTNSSMEQQAQPSETKPSETKPSETLIGRLDHKTKRRVFRREGGEQKPESGQTPPPPALTNSSMEQQTQSIVPPRPAPRPALSSVAPIPAPRSSLSSVAPPPPASTNSSMVQKTRRVPPPIAPKPIQERKQKGGSKSKKSRKHKTRSRKHKTKKHHRK